MSKILHTSKPLRIDTVIPLSEPVSTQIGLDELWHIIHIASEALSSEVRYQPNDELSMAHQRIKRLEDGFDCVRRAVYKKLGVEPSSVSGS